MFYSPLRYPGGKGKIAPFIKCIIECQKITNGTYIEPFAGGAGIAMELLCTGIVDRVVINDYDKGIYSFWKALLTESDRFINTIINTPVSVSEWKKQREIIIKNGEKYSFELGFATFYLNRTNRSGIIKGGVIGGINQKGNWKIDARFDKSNLIKRIECIVEKRNNIVVYNKDVVSFIEKYMNKYSENSFVYFDPPYFQKGRQLYLNYFNYEDHLRIEKSIREKVEARWIITYDCAPEIMNIYKDHVIRMFDINYSMANKCKTSEFIIFKNISLIPKKKELLERDLKVNIRSAIRLQE